MNILDFKKEFSIETLSLVRQFDTNKIKTSWLAHWDNERRIRVVIHEAVAYVIKENTSFDDLAYKVQEVDANETRAAYTRIVIIIAAKPKKVENPDWSEDKNWEKYMNDDNYDYSGDSYYGAYEGDSSNYWNTD